MFCLYFQLWRMEFFFSAGYLEINSSSLPSHRMNSPNYSRGHIPELNSLFGNVFIWSGYITMCLISRSKAESMVGIGNDLKLKKVGFTVLGRSCVTVHCEWMWILDSQLFNVILFYPSKYGTTLIVCGIWHNCGVSEGIIPRMWQIIVLASMAMHTGTTGEFMDNLRRSKCRQLSLALRIVSH